MPDLWVDVDTAIEAPMSLMPIMQDDGTTIEPALVYNFAGIAVQWNFLTTAGVYTTDAITPTTSDDHDITEKESNQGLYGIDIPASGGDADNDTEGIGWITGSATGLLPWRGPTIGCRAAAINNSLIDGATVDVNVTALAADVITPASVDEDSDFVVQKVTLGTMSVTGQADAGSVVIDDGVTIACSTENKTAIKATGGATGGHALELIGTGTGLDIDAANLNYLMGKTTGVAADADLETYVPAGSVMSHLMATGADVTTFLASTDSMQSIRDAIAAAADVSYNPDSSSTVNTGDETNDYTDAAAPGGDSWQIGDADGDSGARHSATSDYTIDVIAEFNMGANRTATEFYVVGNFNRATGNNVVEFWAYNYISASWDKLSLGTASTEMRDEATLQEYTMSLNSAYTDIATTPGEVKIGFVGTDSGAVAGTDVLYLDYIAVSGAAVGGTTPAAIAEAVHAELDSHLTHIPCFTGEIRYVSKSGDDGNSGHVPDQAFLTVLAGLAASSAGDRLVVKAGTYDENGLALSVDGLELVCEIGTIFQNSSSDTVLTVSGNACIVDGLLLEPTAGEIGVVVSGNYCRITNVYPHVAGATGWSITGEHNVFTQCRADNYTATGFNITNAENIFDQCIAYGEGATRGYYFSHTNAHENLMNACVSINNDTGGIEFVAGADLNITQAHTSAGETTPYTDGGTSNVILINTDYAEVNTVQVEGADATTQLESAVDAGLDNALPATPTADSINDYINRIKKIKVNKQTITIANGNTVIYADDDSTPHATVTSAYTSDSTTITRKRLE